MSTTVVCFLLGTQIETPQGERKIESLKIGDRVTTVSGKSRAIKWIGRMGFRRSRDNWPEACASRPHRPECAWRGDPEPRSVRLSPTTPFTLTVR